MQSDLRTVSTLLSRGEEEKAWEYMESVGGEGERWAKMQVDVLERLGRWKEARSVCRRCWMREEGEGREEMAVREVENIWRDGKVREKEGEELVVLLEQRLAGGERWPRVEEVLEKVRRERRAGKEEMIEEKEDECTARVKRMVEWLRGGGAVVNRVGVRDFGNYYRGIVMEQGAEVGSEE